MRAVQTITVEISLTDDNINVEVEVDHIENELILLRTVKESDGRDVIELELRECDECNDER